jgi:hypothetical protein
MKRKHIYFIIGFLTRKGESFREEDKKDFDRLIQQIKHLLCTKCFVLFCFLRQSLAM